MVTVASLVFSMTLVTLQLASSQLGPRLIARFMRDRINQVVLGTFIATFIYTLLVLQTVTEGDPEPFVPHVSVTVALALTLLSLGWLVYFIHHVAASIQADTVIAEVAADLAHALERLFPGPAAEGRAVAATAPVPAEVLEARRSGSGGARRLHPGDRCPSAVGSGAPARPGDRDPAPAWPFRDRRSAADARLAGRARAR